MVTCHTEATSRRREMALSRGDKAKERGIKRVLGVKRINEIGRMKKEKISILNRQSGSGVALERMTG